MDVWLVILPILSFSPSGQTDDADACHYNFFSTKFGSHGWTKTRAPISRDVVVVYVEQRGRRASQSQCSNLWKKRKKRRSEGDFCTGRDVVRCRVLRDVGKCCKRGKKKSVGEST